MDFSLSAEHVEVRTAVIDFATKRLAGSGFSRDTWRLCAEQGLLGVSTPPEYGGSGHDALTAAIAMEALGFAGEDLGFAFSLAAHVFACAKPIEKFGSDEQKRTWLPRMCSGELIATHAITEPEAGSDVFAMRTVAKRQPGGDYLINGSKCFSTNAPVADVLLVQARTGESGFFSLGAFLVDAKAKGVTIGAPHQKIGLEGSPIADIYFDDCRVRESERLGAEGLGASIFMHSMTWERTCLFGIYVGAMGKQLDLTIEQARTRQQFGQPIAKFQGVAHKIADMKVRLEAARLLMYKSAWNIGRSADDGMDASIAKLFISEAAVQSALDTMQIHGATGIMTGRIERYLRDALPSRIFSGTSEIQRNNIARALGL